MYKLKNIAVWVLALVISAGALIGMYSLLCDSTQDIVVSYIEELAEHDMRNIQEFVSNQWKEMEELHKELSVRNLNTLEEIQYEVNLKSETKDHEHIYLIDADGRLYSDEYKVYGAADSTGRHANQVCKNGGVG